VVTALTQRHKCHFGQDEIDQMIIDYTEHRLTARQIAGKYQCGRATVSSVLKRNGVTLTMGRMDEAMIAKAQQLCAEGLTLKQVGERLCICESTVRRTLARTNINAAWTPRKAKRLCKRTRPDDA
ncbi:MAG: helix-turn-helix domain-containing protein, partial [Coriobacteriales bacterium]|nr:helix-turn-helix domain-containing protein [Coriobacteriales bacterium]